MPICDDPDAHGYYILRSDRGKPNPLRFKCKCLTIAQSRAIASDFDESLKLSGQDAVCSALLEKIIKPFVIGWNDEGFGMDALAERLNRDEVIELALGIDYATAPTEDDLKKSVSDVSSAPASSANDAAQAA